FNKLLEEQNRIEQKTNDAMAEQKKLNDELRRAEKERLETVRDIWKMNWELADIPGKTVAEEQAKGERERVRDQIREKEDEVRRIEDRIDNPQKYLPEGRERRFSFQAPMPRSNEGLGKLLESSKAQLATLKNLAEKLTTQPIAVFDLDK